MPYLWTKAVEAHRTGVPMMRAMTLEFPDDPGCDGLDRQYMLGDALLVAPVFSDDVVDFYVPAGRWTSLLDGRTVEGPRWIRETHGFLSLPLLVREGTLLATEEDGETILTAYGEGGTAVLYDERGENERRFDRPGRVEAP